jgi:uncharacterized membrane protein YbhN (UPF0104 family)
MIDTPLIDTLGPEKTRLLASTRVRWVVDQLPRGAVAGSLVALIALLALAFAPHALGPELSHASSVFSSAQALPLCVGCALFAMSLVCSARMWRTTVTGCGGPIERTRASAYYAIGSLASTIFPGRAGDAVRVGLFSRSLQRDGAIWTASGILVAQGVIRTAALSGLLVAAVALGAVPLWPLVALAGMATIAVLVALRVRRTEARSRSEHLLDAFRLLGRSPRTLCVLAGWAVASIAARVGATSATAAALGVHSPLLAGLVIVPAMEVAGLLPLTPGNVGVADGAIAVALRVTGAHFSQALAIAIALHAVETLASLACGGWAIVYLAGERSPRSHRARSAIAGTACALVAAALIAAVAVA